MYFILKQVFESYFSNSREKLLFISKSIFATDVSCKSRANCIITVCPRSPTERLITDERPWILKFCFFLRIEKGLWQVRLNCQHPGKIGKVGLFTTTKNVHFSRNLNKKYTFYFIFWKFTFNNYIFFKFYSFNIISGGAMGIDVSLRTREICL